MYLKLFFIIVAGSDRNSRERADTGGSGGSAASSSSSSSGNSNANASPAAAAVAAAAAAAAGWGDLSRAFPYNNYQAFPAASAWQAANHQGTFMSYLCFKVFNVHIYFYFN